MIDIPSFSRTIMQEIESRFPHYFGDNSTELVSTIFGAVSVMIAIGIAEYDKTKSE